MDCLQLKYRLFSDRNAERTLFVRAYKLVDEEEKLGKVLEVLNVPFFVEENDLKNLLKNQDVHIRFATSKISSDKLKAKTALVEFQSKNELKNELRLIKYSDEKLFLYKDKAGRSRTRLYPHLLTASLREQDDFKAAATRNCGKSLLSRRFVSYIEDIDETRDRVMEIMANYNDEILVAQKKKKRRYEHDDDGWTTVVRK